MAHGDKRDYPKIDLYWRQPVAGGQPRWAYAASTTWSRTCKEARRVYAEAHNMPESDVKARFA